MPNRSKPARAVTVVVPEGGQFFGVAGPVEAFQIANELRHHRGRPPAYALTIAAVEEEVRTSAGLRLRAEPLAALVDRSHTVLVGGRLEMTEERASEAFLDALRPHVRGAERIVSVCAGAFVLGDLGLLDGRPCTTHWMAVDALARRFPKADVRGDALYVNDANLFTSAGCTAGIDLALHLIAQDLGPRMALAVARLMVVFLHRPGGQSQFSAGLTVRAHSDARLSSLMSEIISVPGGDYTVESMARRAGMSPRNFARAFRKATGKPPATYVRDVRVDAARGALEATEQSVAEIASACGLGSEETLRRVFNRFLGVSPAAYRRRFRSAG